MMKKIWKQLKNRKGFTLIELIVVIAVLGILAAIALPRVGDVTSNARNRADEEQVRILNEALERYIAESGDSTLSSDDLKDNNTLTVKSIIDGLQGTINYGSETYGPYLQTNSIDSENPLPSGETLNFDSTNLIFKLNTDS